MAAVASTAGIGGHDCHCQVRHDVDNLCPWVSDYTGAAALLDDLAKAQ